MFYILYETINLVNNKKYRGVHQTKNLNDEYLGSGKILHKAIEKYGIDNFERKILVKTTSTEELYELEKQYVNEEFVKREDTYNVKIGGNGGWDHIDKSIIKKRVNKRNYNDKKYKNKLSKAIKNVHRKGNYSKNIKNLKSITTGFKNKTHSKETKKKIGHANSIKQTGKNNSQYGTMWITNGKENRKIKKVDKIPDGWYKGRKIVNYV